MTDSLRDQLPPVVLPRADSKPPTQRESRGRLSAIQNDPWFWCLCALICMLFLSRLSTTPLRGEETRWARIAIEMQERGDWIVPHQQGAPFLSRPPLGSWLIGLTSTLLGSCSTLAIRLPTACASIGITLLVYLYARRVLSTAGALAAALAYATFGLSIISGRVAETDTLFTALVSGSLIAWHWCYSLGTNPTRGWCLGYALAAFATLAKGPQAPTYFVAVTAVYLLIRRDWKVLFHRGHLLGVLLYLAIMGCWLVPFGMRLGVPGVRSVFVSDVGMRYARFSWDLYCKHLLMYPLEVFGCLLPWSPLLLVYVQPALWKSLRPLKLYFSFWAICILITFPTCWLVPNARGRYYQPMFPIIALLIGVVVDRALSGEFQVVPARLAWKWMLYGVSVVLAAGVVVLIAAGVLPIFWLRPLAQTVPMTLGYSTFAIGCLLVLTRAVRDPSAGLQRIALFSIAAMVGATIIGPLLSGELRGATTGVEAVAKLETLLPPDTKLVSLGPVSHQFMYYYGKPVELRPSIREGTRLEPGDEYFCFGSADAPYRPQELPFAWEPVAIISCERAEWDFPRHMVVVGRRLDDDAPTNPKLTLDQVEDIRHGRSPGRLR